MAKKKQASARKRAGTEDENVDFEAALAEIEQIVAHLESGELGLSDSLDKYEVGVRQLKRCHQLLDAAEQRVSLLSGFDAEGNAITEPIDEGSIGKPARGKSNNESSNTGPNSRRSESGGVDGSPGLF